MKRFIAILSASIVLSVSGIAQTSDEQQVRATINQYFQGHATADPAEMRKAFLPTAHIEGIREGKFVSWTAAM